MLRHLLHFWLFQFLSLGFAAAAVIDPGAAAGGDDGAADSGGHDSDADGASSEPSVDGGDGPRSDSEGDHSGGDGADAEGQRDGQQPKPATDAKLDARTLPASLKNAMAELQKADPKAHTWLKDRLYAERVFREKVPGGIKELDGILSTVGTLRELVPPTMGAASTEQVIGAIREELADGRALDDLFSKGDPKLFEKMIEFSADGFKKLLPAAVSKYQQLDPEGYQHWGADVIMATMHSGNVLNTLGFVSRLLAKGDATAVATAVEELKSVMGFFGEIDKISKTKPAAAAAADPKHDQASRDLDARETKLWIEETARPINTAKTSAIQNELKQYLKGQTIDDETYDALEAQCLRYVDEILRTDPHFAPTFNSYIENKDRAGITKFMAAKLKEILPSKVVNGQKKIGPVERAYKLFFKGATPAARPGGQQQQQRGGQQQQQQRPAPKGWEKVSPDKAPQPHEIDRAKTSFEMSFAKAAILKNGKKIYWGDQAPA